MPKKTISQYVLDTHKLKRLRSLECQICKKTVQIGDIVVTKRRKTFHKNCWNSTWIDISDDILTPQEKYFVEFGFYPDEQINTISPCSISMQTIQTLS